MSLAAAKSPAALLFAVVLLSSCASFSVLTPADNATVTAPVATDIFWNADLQANTLKIVLDPGPNQTDITSQFPSINTSADSHATAHLPLSQGIHTLSVSGNLWDATSHAYTAQSASRRFDVNNSLAAGQPVTYTLTVFNFNPGQPNGYLGTTTFGGTDPNAPNFNVNLIFTFTGNTADVIAYTAPRPCQPNCTNHAVNDGSGFEIVSGTATVAIQDAATLATIATGTFTPAAGMFVSVDNGNGGIGFGSHGALPSDPSFPNHGVEVAYPYGQFAAPHTDLKSTYRATAIWDLSCVGFNGTPGTLDPATGCNVPYDLPTTAGAFKIFSNNPEDLAPPGVSSGVFTTVTAATSAGDNASITIQGPGSLQVGASGTVTVTATNTGTSTWTTAYGLTLLAQGRVTLTHTGVPLTGTVPPGQSTTLSFTANCASQGVSGVSAQMTGQSGVFGEHSGTSINCHP